MPEQMHDKYKEIKTPGKCSPKLCKSCDKAETELYL